MKLPHSTTALLNVPISNAERKSCLQLSMAKLRDGESLSSSTLSMTSLSTSTRTIDLDVGEEKDELIKQFLKPDTSANSRSLSLQERDAILENELFKDPSTATNRYIMLGLLWSIACLSALDRVAMSVAILPMAQEFTYFTDTVKGSISSFFSIGYGLAILPAGLLVANLSPRKVMSVGLSTWSLATVATALVLTQDQSSMSLLLLARALVGAGESVILPTIQRLLISWTTSKEKTTALAAIYSGFHIGTIAAYTLSPVVMDGFGDWRGLFYAYGAVGLLILAPWLALAKDSPQMIVSENQGSKTDAVPPQALSLTDSVGEAMQTVRAAPWKGFFSSKGTWGILLAHCAKNVGLYVSLAWIPTFYSEQYGIGVRDSALLSVLPSITGAVCGVLAGATADSFIRNLEDGDVEMRGRIRKGFQTIAFLGQSLALGTLALNVPEEPWVAQLFLMASYGLMAFNTSGFEAGIQEKAGNRWTGLLYSVTSLPAVICGTAGVYATGLILDATNQDWSWVFGLIAASNLVGNAAFVALYDPKQEFD